MPTRRNVIGRILWPEKPSLFIIIGGAAGMVGDLANFFGDMVSPYYMVALFGVIAAIAMSMCLQRAFMVNADNKADVDAVVSCRACDAMRFGLFAFAAFILLVIVGQGQSATAVIGEKLGLIQKDVSEIKQDVGEIKQNVTSIAEVAQSGQIFSNPKSAEEFFANAWIYTNMRRDTASAYAAMQQMYSKFAPNKLDAAEMFFNSARGVKSRTELAAEAEALGKSIKDATLLVVAARNAPTAEEADRLYAEAANIDADQPFAYWDMQNPHSGITRASAGGSTERMIEALQKQVDGQKKFIEKISAKPVGYYFFLPQYQGDFEMIARQSLSGLEANLETLKGLRKPQ